MCLLNAALMSSAKHDWGTPQPFFDRLDAEFGFTMDVCATMATSKCGESYYGPDNIWHRWRDGLGRPWYSDRCWMNPPYGREIPKWVAKAAEETQNGCPLVVGLPPARTDTRWWHDHVMQATEIRLVKGRLRFEGAPSSAPFPSAVVIWTPYRPPGGPIFTTMEARL